MSGVRSVSCPSLPVPAVKHAAGKVISLSGDDVPAKNISAGFKPDCAARSFSGRANFLHSGVDLLRRINGFLTDVIRELFPDGFHRFDPLRALFGVQLADRAARVDDRLT